MTSRKPRRIDPNAAIKARIAALPPKAEPIVNKLVPAATDFKRGAAGMVIEAAKLRRISVPAYIRRAAYAFAAHDLGLPLSDALSRDPRVSRENGFSVEDPLGVTFGPWEIAGLVGEEPEDG